MGLQPSGKALFTSTTSTAASSAKGGNELSVTDEPAFGEHPINKTSKAVKRKQGLGLEGAGMGCIYDSG
jgi:hypothetical protein